MAAHPSSQTDASSLDGNKSKICDNCDTTITSLWRNGPSGHKSLCNACGLRYRRKGLEPPKSESKEDKGKNRRRVDRIQHYRKVIDLYTNGDNRKNNTKNQDPGELDMGSMFMTTDSRNDLMLQQIEQHGEEVVKAAIILMDISGATWS